MKNKPDRLSVLLINEKQDYKKDVEKTLKSIIETYIKYQYFTSDKSAQFQVQDPLNREITTITIDTDPSVANNLLDFINDQNDSVIHKILKTYHYNVKDPKTFQEIHFIQFEIALTTSNVKRIINDFVEDERLIEKNDSTNEDTIEIYFKEIPSL